MKKKSQTFVKRRQNKEYDLFTLANGIRVVHVETEHTRVARCGVVFDIGGRDEPADKHGLAHFWEHMAFKGAGNRKAYHIINRLESVGGELNAFTTKEKMAFYASALDEHFDRALELVRDVAFLGYFPEKEIERERGVILEEMAMYRDAPDDAIQDDFDALTFKDHPLGVNILGNPESIRKIQRQDFLNFIDAQVDFDKLVVTSVGPLSSEKVFRAAEKYFGGLERKTSRRVRTPFADYAPRIQTVRKPVSQARCIMGSTAYPLNHPNRPAFVMLVNILGGPGMNSRLNMALREQRGYAYTVEADYYAFTDTGQFSVYFATEAANLKKSERIVLREIDKLKSKPLGERQLKAAKQQLKGQLAMAEENRSCMMLSFAKSLLDKNRIASIDETLSQIDAITAKDLQQTAAEILIPENFCKTLYLPLD